jgi:hypothetical protein
MRFNKKARSNRFGLFKYYPAYAVWADLPFPFGNGRMTVAAASDFQLRHVIFSVRPSLLGISTIGSGIPPVISNIAG